MDATLREGYSLWSVAAAIEGAAELRHTLGTGVECAGKE